MPASDACSVMDAAVKATPGRRRTLEVATFKGMWDTHEVATVQRSHHIHACACSGGARVALSVRGGDHTLPRGRTRPDGGAQAEHQFTLTSSTRSSS